jgi:hypothetical protein
MTVPVICPCGSRPEPCLYPACVEGERTATFQRAWLPDLYPPIEPVTAGGAGAHPFSPGGTDSLDGQIRR